MRSGKRNVFCFLLSIVLSSCLLWGSFLTSKSISRWKALSKATSLASRDLERQKAIRKELARRQRMVARVEGFIKKAGILRLTPDKWDQYDVEISGPISFPQLGEILGQTATGKNYYFEPLILYMAKKPPIEKGETPGSTKVEGPKVARAKGKIEEGDIFLELKGNFLVRR